MDKLDKAICQRYGKKYNLTPVWQYMLKLVLTPVGNDVTVDEIEPGLFKVTKNEEVKNYGLFGKVTQSKEERVWYLHLQDIYKYPYNFYYDDPEESDTERDALVLNDVKPSPFLIDDLKWVPISVDGFKIISHERFTHTLNYQYNPL